MSLLSQIHAGYDPTVYRIPCLELACSAWPETIRYCPGWDDVAVGLGSHNLVTGWEPGYIHIDSVDEALDTSLSATRTTGWFPVSGAVAYDVEVVSGESDRRRVQWRLHDGSLQYDGYSGTASTITAPADAVAGRIYYATTDVASPGEIAVRAGELLTFHGAGLDLALPASDDSGNQRLVFAIGGLNADAEALAELAIEAGAVIHLMLRIYASSDLSAPAEPPLRMIVDTPEFLPDGSLQVPCTHRDILGRRWLQHRFTAGKYPGVALFT